LFTVKGTQAYYGCPSVWPLKLGVGTRPVGRKQNAKILKPMFRATKHFVLKRNCLFRKY